MTTQKQNAKQTAKEAVAIIGAMGHMGQRLHNSLKDSSRYRLLYVEGSREKEQQLEAMGLVPSSKEDVAREADIVVFAVPDSIAGVVAHDVVPALRSGTLVVFLDPAAPHAGALPKRDDISLFVTHPAHPPVFNDETDPKARRDYFGSGLAKQAIINALVQGPEEDYDRGEQLAQEMFGPILRSHRVTLEQMALLEPGLTETVAATCIKVIRDAMDITVARGVPFEAARDFLLGHINIELAILFDEIEWDFSAGAKQAMADAERMIFRSDWQSVLSDEEVLKSVRRIAGMGNNGS